MFIRKLPSGISIAQAKKDAKKLAARENKSISKALDLIAFQHGRSTWPVLMQQIEKQHRLEIAFHNNDHLPLTEDKSVTMIVGYAGTGKSVLLAEISAQLLASGHPVLLISPWDHNGDVGKTISGLKSRYKNLLTTISAHPQPVSLDEIRLNGAVLLIDDLELINDIYGKESVLSLQKRAKHAFISCDSPGTSSLGSQDSRQGIIFLSVLGMPIAGEVEHTSLIAAVRELKTGKTFREFIYLRDDALKLFRFYPKDGKVKTSPLVVPQKTVASYHSGDAAITGDILRKRFSDLHLNIEDLTPQDYMDLHRTLSEHLKNSGLFDGHYRMDPLRKGKFQHMTCSSTYFDGREAVSFNRDGFIGFAGWASSSNAQPIYAAFNAWMDSLVARGSMKRFWLFTIPSFGYSPMAGLVGTAGTLQEIEQLRQSFLRGASEPMESHVFDSLTGVQAEWPLYNDDGKVDFEVFRNVSDESLELNRMIDKEAPDPFVCAEIVSRNANTTGKLLRALKKRYYILVSQRGWPQPGAADLHDTTDSLIVLKKKVRDYERDDVHIAVFDSQRNVYIDI